VPVCDLGNYRRPQKITLCKSAHEGAATGYRLYGAGRIMRTGAAAAQVCGADAPAATTETIIMRPFYLLGKMGMIDLRKARRRRGRYAGRGRGHGREIVARGSGLGISPQLLYFEMNLPRIMAKIIS
jgi:hypothetical protein